MSVLVKILFSFAVGAFCLLYRQDINHVETEQFTFLEVDAKSANIEMFLKFDSGINIGSIENLQDYAEKNGERLRFAMNGGMYQEDGKPLGLYIENGKVVTPLNTRRAVGNFYLQPNGVFYITDDQRAFVVKTEDFQTNGNIKFATQSGPMLLVDGQINLLFQRDSQNLNVRNGVCAAENNRVIFAISRREVNFYDFAEFFKNAGCRNALYLDGFVSRMYAPEKNITQIDGDFGVIIGIVEK